MTKNNPGLFYGILCGISMCAWVLVEFVLGFHTTAIDIGQYSDYVLILFPIIYIFLALQNRQRHYKNRLTFIDGINTGFRLAFFSALILTLFFYVYIVYINPDWIQAAIEWQRKKLLLSGATDDQIEQFMNRNRVYNNSLGQAVMEFISTVGIGVLVTLVEIPIVKKIFSGAFHTVAKA